MDVHEKTPEQQLLTKFYSIQGRLRRGLPTEEQNDAQRALERTRKQLVEMGVRIQSK